MSQNGHSGETTVVITRLKASGKTISYTLPGSSETHTGREESPHEHLYTIHDANGNLLFDVRRSSRPADFVVVLYDAAGRIVLRLKRTHFCTRCMSYGVYRDTKNYNDANLLFMMEKKFQKNSVEISFPPLATAPSGSNTAPKNSPRPKYRIRTKPLDLGFKIIRNERLVTEVRKSINLSMLKGQNKYTMSVHSGEDRALLSSMVVVFDMMKLPGFSLDAGATTSVGYEGDDRDGGDSVGGSVRGSSPPDSPDGSETDSHHDNHDRDHPHDPSDSYNHNHPHDHNHHDNHHDQDQQHLHSHPHHTCDAIHDASQANHGNYAVGGSHGHHAVGGSHDHDAFAGSHGHDAFGGSHDHHNHASDFSLAHHHHVSDHTSGFSHTHHSHDSGFGGSTMSSGMSSGMDSGMSSGMSSGTSSGMSSGMS